MRVGIFGAGSIGCYIGACLIRGGVDVLLVGRERLRDEVAAHGMRVTDADGASFQLQPGQVPVAVTSDALADCDLILVTVKSADTPSAAAAIAKLPTRPGRCVVSFQNGIRNAEQLRQALKHVTVVAGMVPWNVVWNADAHFHRGTSGELMLAADGAAADAVAALLNAAQLRTLLRRDLLAVLWGKLLLNLNNPINALSGMPLRQQLATRGYRRLLAALMREALQVMRHAGVRPAKAAKLTPGLVPWVLDLPDAVFLRVASSMLKLDPQARSSMWEDLQRGRLTEIDYINGEVVRLAAESGTSAPLNQALVELVHRNEGAAGATVSMSPEDLSAAVYRHIN